MAHRNGWRANPVIYEVYPRSFRDTTGSGEGDLRGVCENLGHIADLGADAIWLAPFFASPMHDGGYDVTDHCAVDPRFGTLSDFDTLVAQAHELGLRVMIDQVFNHTSDQHEWFLRSKAREPGYEDFYVWADACDDGAPPTNWIGYFGMPAWQWHPERAQYCLHKFLPFQPALNHYCPEVLQRLCEVTQFWCARGVDGFRYDAVTSFYHGQEWIDNPPAGPEEQNEIPGPSNNPFTMQEHVHDVLPDDCVAFSRNLRHWAGPDSYLLGEVNNGTRAIELTRALTEEGALDACYTVTLHEKGLTEDTMREILECMNRESGHCWWLSCHDQARHVSKLGDGSSRDARMFAAFLTALPGAILLFQGEELGQQQADLPLEQIQDPFDRFYWPETAGREGARTPFAWDDNLPRCGFSGQKPWLPVHAPPEGGAAQQAGRPGSVLEFYRDGLRQRRELGLADGDMEVLAAPGGCVAIRVDTPEAGKVVMAVNFTHETVTLDGIVKTDEMPVLQSVPVEDGRLPPRSAAWWRLSS